MSEYYNGDRIRKTGADMMIIFGQRSSGKTYDAIAHAVREYIRDESQFVYMRRYEDEITPSVLSELLSGHADQITEAFGEGATCRYYSRKFMLNTPEKKDIIGHTMSISGYMAYKGSQYPRVKTIILDEFLSKRPYSYVSRNPTQEVDDFLQNVSTIVRGRTDVKIYLLGNTVTRNNAFFKVLGIDPEEIQIGQIVKFSTDKGLKIAVERTPDAAASRKSEKYFDFDTTAARMITSGEWEAPEYNDKVNGEDAKKAISEWRSYREGVRIHYTPKVSSHGVYIYLPSKRGLPLVASTSCYRVNSAIEVADIRELTLLRKKMYIHVMQLVVRGLYRSTDSLASENFELFCRNSGLQ